MVLAQVSGAVATYGSRSLALIPVCFAWGPGDLKPLPNGRTVWRMAFELLPGATMQNAACMLYGMVCCDVSVDSSPYSAELRWRVEPGTQLEVWAVNGTDPTDLQPHLDEIIKAFRVHMDNLQQTA